MQKPIIKLQILDYILGNPGASMAEIAEKFDLNLETIKQHLYQFPKLKHITIYNEVQDNVRRFFVEIK